MDVLLLPLLPQDLVVPIEVDVVLVGFSGDGGYGYTLDSSKLLSMLSSHLQVREGDYLRRGFCQVQQASLVDGGNDSIVATRTWWQTTAAACHMLCCCLPPPQLLRC